MAILTKAQLEALNQSSFPDQSTEAITPAILRNYNTQTIDTLVDSLDTGSFVTSAITASSLITASVNLNTITFTKGNGSTFDITVNTGSGGGTTDISSLNAFTASQLTINSGLNASTASQQVSINNLNSTTASINSSITQLNASSASQQISINALNTNSGSVNSSITQLNASSASQQISINALNAATSSYVTESETGSFVTNIANNPLTPLTFTYDQPGSSTNVTLDLPSGILSSSVTNFIDYSTSVDSRINAITASGGIPAGTISGSQQITSLGFVSSSVTASSIVTASVNNDDITFTKGDGSQFTIQVATGSFALSASYAETASFALNGGVTQILAGPNIIVSPLSGQGQVTISSTGTGSGGFNTATGSYGSFYDTTTQTNPVANAANSMSFNETAITNGVSVSGSTNPFNTYIKTENAGVYNLQFSAQLDKTDSGTDSVDIWIRKNGIDLLDTGTTVTLTGNNDKSVAAWNWFVQSAANDYYQIIWASADTDMRLLAEASSSVHPGIPSVIATANRVDQFLSNTGSFSGSFTGTFNGYNLTEFTTTSSFNSYTSSNDTKWSNLAGQTGSYVTSAITASSLVTASFSGNTLTFTKGDSSTFGVVIPDVSGSTIDTGSFATTGSNVFIGDQTLSDGSGNNSTIAPWSGSFVLVAKGITSGSAGLSNITSSANLVNLIFKNNNANSGSLTLSGSNNILIPPATPTAGFRRQVTSNNIFLTTALPEVTGSLSTYSPTITGNMGNNIIRFRGPASSSAWSMTANIVNANLNIGNADATSANQAVAGGNITTNLLLAAVNYNAYTTPLVAQAVFQANLSVGNSTLTAFSSSIAANNNIFVGNTFTVNNRYFGTSSTNAAQRLSLQNNVFGGFGTPTLTAEGSNTSTSAPREAIGNTTNGGGLAIGLVLSGDNSHLYSTLIHGSNLTVTGSNAYNTQASAGSTFIGRNNSVNGNAARSGETIFAVGTGTGTGARKTGFLIDSGSNTFVEGTLNVSGSTSFNGAVNITGSLTSSLTEGYVWVGGAGNVSTLAATSSFGGGSVPAGTVSSSAQITTLGFVSSSVTASSLITASVNLNTITFTKGDSSTFAITVDTGSTTIPAGTVSSSAQIVAYNKFATTGSNTFNDYQIIKSNLSFQEATGLEDNNMILSSLNKTTLYISNTSISSGYASGSLLQLTTTTGSTGFGSGSTVFQMDAVYEGNTAAMKVGSTVGLGSYVQGFADKIEFAKAGGFPNTPATTFRVDAASIELSGSVKMNTGSSGSAGIVSVGSGGTTVNNGLVTSNSIILATTQELGSGDEYPAVVSGKTAGSFTLNHNFGGSLNVAYLIINPI